MNQTVGIALTRIIDHLERQNREKHNCDKLQYTPYGKCAKCDGNSECQNLKEIKNMVAKSVWEGE